MLLAAFLLQAAATEVQEPISKPEPAAIAWYSDLAQARADAKRLQRPLFLMAATPQCRSIAGMW